MPSYFVCVRYCGHVFPMFPDRFIQSGCLHDEDIKTVQTTTDYNFMLTILLPPFLIDHDIYLLLTVYEVVFLPVN